MEHDVISMPQLLKTLQEQGGSDLHLKAGRPPMMRLRGDLLPMAGHAVLGPEDVERLVDGVINADQHNRLHAERELDFSFAIPGVAQIVHGFTDPPRHLVRDRNGADPFHAGSCQRFTEGEAAGQHIRRDVPR